MSRELGDLQRHQGRGVVAGPLTVEAALMMQFATLEVTLIFQVAVLGTLPTWLIKALALRL